MNANGIKSYHAHIYYEPDTKPDAERLRSAMEAQFPDAVYGRWHDRPVGPHPSAMYQVAFPIDHFAAIVPWLILNHGSLTVFLHPNTGKALTDHSQRAVWMGRQQELVLGMLTDHE